MNFKTILLLITLSIFCISCNKNAQKPSLAEIGKELEMLSGNPTEKLPDMREYVDSTSLKKYDGICTPIIDNDKIKKAKLFVKKESNRLRESGYLLFTFENNERKTYLATIKSNDELDIVRWRNTDGINYGLNNKDIVEKLKEWNEKNPIEVLEVGLDFIFFKFKERINQKNINNFAKEVYTLCPDVVDQGVGDMDALTESIKRINSVFLWWD